MEEVNKEVKMFWLFFAATGLAVAVAVDVGGINMNTGVNTGDFLYYLFIIYDTYKNIGVNTCEYIILIYNI